MIPLRDLGRGPGIAPVTALLVVVNVAVWIWTLTLAGDPAAMNAFYARWSVQPSTLFTSPATADALMRLLTYQFVHAGWLHITGNMLFLWVFGAAVEMTVGRIRFLTFYLLAGIFAALCQGLYQLAVGDTGDLVGASGAISGVLGAYIVLAPMARVRALVPLGLFITPMNIPAVLLLGEWLVLQVLSAFNVLGLGYSGSRVAYFAHLGGFLAGFAVFGLAKVARRLSRVPAQS